jgi:hypothetical protein
MMISLMTSFLFSAEWQGLPRGAGGQRRAALSEGRICKCQ